MKTLILISFAMLLTSCGTIRLGGPSVESFVLFKGEPAEDCRYLSYIDSEYTGSDKDSGFNGARNQLKKRAVSIEANAIKIINYNVALTTFRLSAEAYSCPNLSALKKDTDQKFSIDETD
jgi:hypothetical protein